MLNLFQVVVCFFLAFWASPALSQCNTPSPTTVVGTFAITNGTICSGDLIFEDNFDSFDLRKWQHEITLAGGGNWEFEVYMNNRTNSYAADGHLHIKPTLLADEYGEDFLFSGTLDLNGGSPADECTDPQFYGCSRTGTEDNALNPIKSARIRTVDSFSFKYGKVEVSAKIPAGDWLWPAIWFLPRFNQYSSWPASGEIDLMESRGNKDLVINGGNIGTQQVSSTLHWGPNYMYDEYQLTGFNQNLEAGYNQDFHKYQLEWTPDHITFSVDDKQIGTVAPDDGGFWGLGKLNDTGFQNPWAGATKMAPFDSEFYILINLAVGGVNGFFPDDATNPGKKPWENNSPTASTDFWKGKDEWYPTWDPQGSEFLIDYVRIYAI